MDVSMGSILLLVTGFLWVVGAILHWHNIKRQERLLARMQRIARVPVPEPPDAEAPAAGVLWGGEALRPARRWTVE